MQLMSSLLLFNIARSDPYRVMGSRSLSFIDYLLFARKILEQTLMKLSTDHCALSLSGILPFIFCQHSSR